MSKKKFATGSTTMTLKDFHGGSIPSELPLPSAPGISTRQPDRPGSWGASSIVAGVSAGPRADHQRPRPGSSGGHPRILDERGPAFLSTPSFIGRHFDEDERKPFDASSGPRRPSISAAETTQPPPVVAVPTASVRSDVKKPVSSSVVAHHLSPSPGVSTSSAGNAWAIKKELPVSGGANCELPRVLPPDNLSEVAVASRFAQASAIEKISSGRWQSKPPDVEVIRFQEVKSWDLEPGMRIRMENDKDCHDERGLHYKAYSGVKGENLGCDSDGVRLHERGRSTLHPEARETNLMGFQSDFSISVSHDGRLPPSQHQQTLDETLERPKLKLLPRTKPLEISDSQMLDFKQGSIMQGYQQSPTSILMEPAQEMHGAASTIRPRSVGTDALNLPVERPKLNLKPRSQPVEQGESEKERKTVFGGARPRELVLKERGVDASGNPEILAQTNRLNKPDALKIESKMERTELSTAEGRNLRDAERKDNRSSYEKSDAQRNSRKNDNWRSRPGETEKPAVERLAEPETWRKPIEPPKPETPPGPRLGKAASALELAQAFSRSMSDSRVDNRYAKQRMIPGRTQLPFSRLTGTTEVYSGSSQRQINGY